MLLIEAAKREYGMVLPAPTSVRARGGAPELLREGWSLSASSSRKMLVDAIW
jgi:hypothetical protein